MKIAGFGSLQGNEQRLDVIFANIDHGGLDGSDESANLDMFEEGDQFRPPVSAYEVS